MPRPGRSSFALLVAMVTLGASGCSADADEAPRPDGLPDLAALSASVDCADYQADEDINEELVATSGTCTFAADVSPSSTDPAALEARILGFKTQKDLDDWFSTSYVFQGSRLAIAEGPRWLLVGDPDVLIDVAEKAGLDFSG